MRWRAWLRPLFTKTYSHPFGPVQGLNDELVLIGYMTDQERNRIAAYCADNDAPGIFYRETRSCT